MDGLAGDVAGVRADEEADQRGDLVGQPEAAERHAGDGALPAGRIERGMRAVILARIAGDDAPGMRREKMRAGGVAEAEEPRGDDGERALETGIVERAERTLVGKAGIGDQHIEPAEALDRGGDQTARRRRLREVAGLDLAERALRRAIRRDLCGALAPLAGMDQEVDA